MAEKMPLRIYKTTFASGGTYDYVRSDAVPVGEIWCLQGISYENETGARGTFRRYIEKQGYDHWLAEHTNPAAGELVFTNEVVYLYGGERLAIRQASCTSGDIIQLYAHGYVIKGKFIE